MGQDNVLCTYVDEHAGDWPSHVLSGPLPHCMHDCVQPKMVQRAEVVEVRMLYSLMFAHHPKLVPVFPLHDTSHFVCQESLRNER